jgi:hypothetical protein
VRTWGMDFKLNRVNFPRKIEKIVVFIDLSR